MRTFGLTCAFCISGVLIGCTGTTEDELRQWITEERNQTRPKVTSLPAPKQFKPEAYSSAGEVEPFSNQKHHRRRMATLTLS